MGLLLSTMQFRCLDAFHDVGEDIADRRAEQGQNNNNNNGYQNEDQCVLN